MMHRGDERETDGCVGVEVILVGGRDEGGRHPYIGHIACARGMGDAFELCSYAKRTSFRASPSVALSYRKSRANHGSHSSQ